MPNQLSCQKYPIHDGSIVFCRPSDIILLTNRYVYVYNKKGMSRNENK